MLPLAQGAPAGKQHLPPPHRAFWSGAPPPQQSVSWLQLLPAATQHTPVVSHARLAQSMLFVQLCPVVPPVAPLATQSPEEQVRPPQQFVLTAAPHWPPTSAQNGWQIPAYFAFGPLSPAFFVPMQGSWLAQNRTLSQ